MIYENLLNNKDYLKLAKDIGNRHFITDGKWDWEHGFGHYQRVARYTKTNLEQLGASKRTIDLGMTAALLHDIGLSESDTNKKDHALKSSQMFRKYLENTNVTEEEKNSLEHAIRDHGSGNEIKSLIGLALVLADKLDITYHRTINSTIQDKINKEVQKIKKVEVEITKEQLKINYETEENADLTLLKNEWAKPFEIPKKMAKILEKDCVFKINNQKIEI